jgi:hypothetical protein
MHYEEMVTLRVHEVLEETLFGEVSSAKVHLVSDAEDIFDMPEELFKHLVSVLGAEAVRVFALRLTPWYGAPLDHDSSLRHSLDRDARKIARIKGASASGLLLRRPMCQKRSISASGETYRPHIRASCQCYGVPADRYATGEVDDS